MLPLFFLQFAKYLDRAAQDKLLADAAAAAESGH